MAVETCGSFGPKTHELVSELGRRVRRATLEENSHQYLVQRIAIAVQRGGMLLLSWVSGQPEQLLKFEVTIFLTLFSSKKGLSIIFNSCIVSFKKKNGYLQKLFYLFVFQSNSDSKISL